MRDGTPAGGRQVYSQDVAKLTLEANTPNTNALLGAALSGGDVRGLARAMLPEGHPEKRRPSWERIVQNVGSMPAQEWAEARLKHMAANPGMWALTKEGFALQVLVILEVLGMSTGQGLAAFQTLHPSGNFLKRVGDEMLGERLDDEFAAKVIALAQTLIAENA
jgi:hypothetical protein